MSWQEFTISVADNLAWPTTVLVVWLSLRSQIKHVRPKTDGASTAPVKIERARSWQEGAPKSIDRSATASAPADIRRIDVHLFGHLRITVDGHEIDKGLRTKAAEVLAFYVLHPEGATLDRAVSILWPEASLHQGLQWFWTGLGNLRGRLRQALGSVGHHAVIIEKRPFGVYRIDRTLVDADVLRFQAAVARVQGAPDDDTLTAALEEAASTCGDDLLEATCWEWVEPARVELRRQAVDVFARLADLRSEQNDFTAAVQALERALELDPYDEEFYRGLLRLHSLLDRPREVQRVVQRMRSALSDLGVDPQAETTKLLNTLPQVCANTRLPS